MTTEQYFQMCEQMGYEPDPDEIPLEISQLDVESQQALLLFNILPDKVEGMNGVWLGKDFSGIGDIMDIYSIENKSDVFEKLIICIQEASKHYAEQRKKK